MRQSDHGIYLGECLGGLPDMGSGARKITYYSVYFDMQTSLFTATCPIDFIIKRKTFRGLMNAIVADYKKMKKLLKEGSDKVVLLPKTKGDKRP